MQQRAAPLDQPVTVAEIYQDLIPYRLVRSFGFALNADYEFALLQLLAGEEKLARIEPPEVREELRLELLSPNPNVGMFRQYAACDVFVLAPDVVVASTARVDEPKRNEGAAERPTVPNDWLLSKKDELAADNGAPAREVAPPSAKGPAAKAANAAPAKAASAAATKTAAAPKSAESPAAPAATHEAKVPTAPPAAPAQSNPRAETGATPVQSAAESRVQHREAISCDTCGKSLPSGRNVRFCPDCGAEQKAPCPSCGTDLDRSWQFCINCGTRVK